MKTSTITKTGAAVLALGLATAAGVGAFGGWTDSDTASMNVQFGTVDLGLGSSTIATAFGTSSSPLAPGDSGYRYVQLTNSGSNAVAIDASIWVAFSAVTDSTGTSATAADIAGDIKVAVDSCSVAWTQSTAACGGSTQSVLAATYLSSLDSSGEAQTLISNFGANATANLRFTLTVDGLESIGSATDGAAVTLTWTFVSTPRAGGSGQ